MSLQEVGLAVNRVIAAFQRRPEMAVHANPAASAQWESGTRVLTRSSEGMVFLTDMPKELGGSGDQVTPGWFFRAGIASCAATSISLGAAVEGVELSALEVVVESRSDARGLLGMSSIDGAPVYAGLFDVDLKVTIAAKGSSRAELESLVSRCLAHSPVPCTLETATPFSVDVNVTSE